MTAAGSSSVSTTPATDAPPQKIRPNFYEQKEALRFIASGVIATCGNMAAVWIARPFLPFKLALTCGFLVGMTLSFLLSKLFAFRSHEWSSARAEIFRFLVVYSFGLVLFEVSALLVRSRISSLYGPSDAADFIGAFVGAGLMFVPSYLGHRFFTYGTARQGR